MPDPSETPAQAEEKHPLQLQKELRQMVNIADNHLLIGRSTALQLSIMSEPDKRNLPATLRKVDKVRAYLVRAQALTAKAVKELDK